MTLINTISEDEVLKATNRLLNGEAPWADAISEEIFKKGCPKLITKLIELFKFMLHQESIPQEFKNASLVHFYKMKGNRRCCDNHGGISLLAIPGKILAHVLLNKETNFAVTESYARRSLMQAKHGWPQHIQNFIAFCSQYSLYPVTCHYTSALHILNTSIHDIFCSTHFSHVSSLVFQSTDFL